jgi:hypothetical protein
MEPHDLLVALSVVSIRSGMLETESYSGEYRRGFSVLSPSK